MITRLEVLYRGPLPFILTAQALGVGIVFLVVKARHWRTIFTISLAEMAVGAAVWPVLQAIYQRPLVPFVVALVGLASVAAIAHRQAHSEGLRVFWWTSSASTSLGVATPLALEGLFRQPLLVCLIVFVIGVATVHTLFKFGTSALVTKQLYAGMMLWCAGVVGLLAVGAWPLFCSLLLFARHEYLLGAIPLLYASPYYLGVAFVLKPILTLAKTAREHGFTAAHLQFHSWQEEWHQKIQPALLDEDAIKEHREGRVWKHFLRLLALFHTLAVAPQTAYTILAIFRFGARWSFLIDFGTPFFALCTLLAYLVANANHPVVALLLSAYLFLVKLYEVTSRFDTRSGVLKNLMRDNYQPRLSDIVFAAVIMASSFGCIHYCISILNPLAYSRPLTAIDGLYFSVTTFATVGYGDIYPSSGVSKLACIVEIASGCLVLLFGVNLAMMVWFQKFTDGQAGAPAAGAVSDRRSGAEPAPPSAAQSLTAPPTDVRPEGV